MLRHKALIQCARLAFSLGGIFDPDEAERIDETNGKVELVSRPGRIVEGTFEVAEEKPKSEVVQNVQTVQQGGVVDSQATVDQPKVEEDNRSKDVPTSSPSAADVGFEQQPTTKAKGPYVGPSKISKLMAVAHSVGLDDDGVHKVLKETWNIDSRKEIPEVLFDEVLKKLGGSKLNIK